MRQLVELNINEAGRPVKRPPPTDAQISDFQRQCGITLPAPYLLLLRHANGGHPELDSIKMPGGSGAGRWAVNSFFHLNDDKEAPNNLWNVVETWRRILGKDGLPIANDGGGNVFFIDTASSLAAVKICVHDDSFAIRDLARSFEEFIDQLSVDPDFI